MMRRPHFLLFLFAVLAASAFAADLPASWRSWRYSRAIDSPFPDALNYITVDREIFAHSESRLADLRIIDDLGSELPYELRSRLSPPQLTPLPATLRENSFVPGQFTQLVVDLGESLRFHNSLRVQTPESDFINWVEVAASDDARLWRIVNSRAPISRFRKENLEGSQTIRYSENNARYLRLRIQETSHQFPVTTVEVFPSLAVENEFLPAEAAPLTAMLLPDAGSSPSQSQWTIDLGSSTTPVAELHFETGQPEFYRAVRILTSADEKEWQPVGGGEIYRYSVAGKTEESLIVRCYKIWGPRYWRAQILNGDDQPLSAVRVSLALASRFLLFKPKPQRAYRLIYGSARAATPQYDLARTLRIQPSEKFQHPGLGAEEPTLNYTDPRPFTERHPNVLWLAVAMAVLLLGYTALRALRSPPSSESV